MVIVEIRRRLLQDPESVCVKRRHGAMPAWAISAGEVLQEELAAAAACFFGCVLLLLLHEGTHALQMMHPSVSPSRGSVVSNGQKVSLVYATLGASLANPKRPESFWPTECSGRISYHPYTFNFGYEVAGR